MTTDSIPAATFYGEKTGTAARLPVQTLDQEDFLQLLVAQMTSQDPLNPKADLEMIPQMAQFTALEQSKAMQADIALLRAEQQVLQANSLLGRTVEILDPAAATPVAGVVDAVLLVEGTPKLVVHGQPYDLAHVAGIRQAVATP